MRYPDHVLSVLLRNPGHADKTPAQLVAYAYDVAGAYSKRQDAEDAKKEKEERKARALREGSAMRKAREEVKKLSLAALAEQVGVRGSHISRYETGKAIPSVAVAEKIRKSLDNGGLWLAMCKEDEVGLSE